MLLALPAAGCYKLDVTSAAGIWKMVFKMVFAAGQWATWRVSLQGAKVMADSIQDQGARWLLHRRHGGDAEQLAAVLPKLYEMRDRVLEHAQIAGGHTLLDVGTGDGLIAFGALPLVGERGRVIFSDISQDLLGHCRQLAEQAGVLDRVRFVCASADDLSPIADAAVDVVTTRSVLIYVERKREAVAEFYRVLKPGGRLSIFEPINRFCYPEPASRFLGTDVTAIQLLAGKVRALYDRLQPVESDPMLDFDERDLLVLAEQAGFHEVHLELRADVGPAKPLRWEVAWQQAGNPKIPTLEEAVAQTLTPEEAERFIAHMRPRVEAGEREDRMAVAYLWATKG